MTLDELQLELEQSGMVRLKISASGQLWRVESADTQARGVGPTIESALADFLDKLRVNAAFDGDAVFDVADADDGSREVNDV